MTDLIRTDLILLGDDRLNDATQVGHKFARQQQLRDAGFRVPEFCCLPVSVFDAVARDLLTAPPESGAEPDLLAWATQSAARLSAAAVPDALAAELLDAVAAMVGGDGAGKDGVGRDSVGGDGLVAVRACVVADADGVGEDGVSDAFAGLTDSFLYVRPRDVPRRVAQCWASGFSPESILYRARRGLAATSARVAVGVQRMVPGARSFVAFSRDPRTGAASCVIAAAHGIGEGVVQERADTDHFFVDSASGEIRAEVVVKERMVTQDGVAGGPVTSPVPPALATAPVLTDDEVRQVSDLVAKVEAFFGLPQDVEGTITPDGAIHLLQARPVVFATPVAEPAAEPSYTPAAEPCTGQRVPWSNHNITESFSGVSGALTYSQARDFYRLAFRDVYRRMGVPQRRLRAQEHHLNRMVGLLDGRVYYRLDAWLALHGQIPGFVLIRRWWERAMGLTGDHRPTRSAVRRALLSVPALAVRLARLPGTVRGFLRWWDDLLDHTTGIDQWSPEELIAFYRRLWAEVGQRWGVTLVNTFFLLGWATLTSAVLRRWVADDEQRILGGLLMGGRENRSVAGVRSAIALAELVAAHPSLAARMRACGPGGETADDIWSDLAGGHCGAPLAAAANEHLHRYGDRALYDLKLEEPSPRQRPGMIVEMIKPMIQSGLTVDASRAGERVSRADAERELRERCPGMGRRLAVRALAAGLRWFVKAREDTRYCRSQLFGLTRQVTWRLGDRLVEAGRLDDRSDVFDLTVEEVLGAYDGTLVDTDLRGVVRRRRAQRRAATDRPGPPVELSTPLDLPVVDGLPAPTAATQPAVDSTVVGTDLRGLPSSTGVVRYQARVVLDPAIPPETCQDRIIVAKETDPGWLFLMMAARGMVVERGTLLSHTAITGRLLGIPTVVSVPNATSLISDGDWIEVDGAAGTVRILAGQEAP